MPLKVMLRVLEAFSRYRILALALAAALVFVLPSALPTQAAGQKPYRVLVVMSYNADFPWSQEIREGIENVMRDQARLTWFWMDTKRDLTSGPDKAAEAYALYQELKPDGVIAADDNAQTMFVVPYLMNKVDTPVVFCGVNADPGIYGYPAGNVTGVRERTHLVESVSFAQQLVPSIRTLCYLAKTSPTADALFAEARSLVDSLSATPVRMATVDTYDQALSMAESLRQECDLLMVAALEGMPGPNGNPVPETISMPAVARIFNGPTIGTSSYAIEAGLLCAVVKTGQEQGRQAAEKLLQAMGGVPVADIPITANIFGKRVINVSELKNLGITPQPVVLKGAQLIRTQ